MFYDNNYDDDRLDFVKTISTTPYCKIENVFNDECDQDVDNTHFFYNLMREYDMREEWDDDEVNALHQQIQNIMPPEMEMEMGEPQGNKNYTYLRAPPKSVWNMFKNDPNEGLIGEIFLKKLEVDKEDVKDSSSDDDDDGEPIKDDFPEVSKYTGKRRGRPKGSKNKPKQIKEVLYPTSLTTGQGLIRKFYIKNPEGRGILSKIVNKVKSGFKYFIPHIPNLMSIAYKVMTGSKFNAGDEHFIQHGLKNMLMNVGVSKLQKILGKAYDKVVSLIPDKHREDLNKFRKYPSYV